MNPAESIRVSLEYLERNRLDPMGAPRVTKKYLEEK